MKILFVYPSASTVSIEQPGWNCAAPYGFECLAATLKPRHEVMLVDLRIEHDLIAVLEQYQPDVIGITGFTKHCHQMIKCLSQIKKYDSKIRTVVGGIHASLAPQDFHNDSVDAILMGEDSFRFRQLVDNWETGKEIGVIGKLHFRSNGTWCQSSATVPPVDLDAYPFPDHSICKPYEKHYRTSHHNFRFMRASLGCPYRCNFCSCWKTVGEGRYYKRSIASVIEEMQSDQHHGEYFLVDDEAFLDCDRMYKMAEEMQKARIKRFFHTECRADTICRHPELFKKWQEVGLSVLTVGLESLIDQDLKEFNKQTTSSMNREAIRHLNRIGIVTHGCFITKPDWTEEDFKKTYRSIVNIFDECPLFLPTFAILTPYPGTDLYEDVKNDLITDNYDFFDGYHSVLPTKLPLDVYYNEYSNLYRNTWEYIRKHPQWTENIRGLERDDFWSNLGQRMEHHRMAGHFT